MDNNPRESAKDIKGKLKEAVGQITGSEGLELKGKLESLTKGIAAEAEELKEKVAEKANDFLDSINEQKNDN